MANAGTIRVVAILVVLATAAHAAAGAAAAPKLLPKAASRLYPVPRTPQSFFVIHPWLSRHELLHIGPDGVLYSFDIAAGKDKRLDILTRQFQQHTKGPSPVALDGSPTGWVLWVSGDNRVHTARTDGSDLHPWASVPTATYRWCSDGHHWLAATTRIPADLLKSRQIPAIGYRTFTVGDILRPAAAVSTIPAPSAMTGQELLRCVSDDRVITRTHDQEQISPWPLPKPRPGQTEFGFMIKRTPRKIQHIFTWDPHRSAPLANYLITLPEPVSEAAVSVDGRRIVWLLSSQRGQSLWVSGIDGGHLREVGIAPATKAANRGSGRRNSSAHSEWYRDLSSVEWCPDGKRIAFVFHDAWWVVAAP